MLPKSFSRSPAQLLPRRESNLCVKYRCLCVVTVRESSVSARGCESVCVCSTIDEILSLSFLVYGHLKLLPKSFSRSPAQLLPRRESNLYYALGYLVNPPSASLRL